MTRLLTSLLPALLLAFAWPAAAQDLSEEEMLKALMPKPQAPVTRGVRGTPIRASDEGKLELSVQFEYASARITPESAAMLKRLAAAMKSAALGERHFRIEGHTDATGSVPGNLRLSARRAESVRHFLAEAGVDEARLSAIGLGSAVLANREDPAAAVNRRVAILSLDNAQMKTAGAPTAASVQRVSGTLKVQRGDQVTALQPGARLREGDVAITEAGGSALVRLDDGAQLLLRENTRLDVGKLQVKGDASQWVQAFKLGAGALRYLSGALGKLRPQAVSFVTTTATIGLRGTDVDVVFVAQPAEGAEAGTYVRVNQGAVALGGLDGSRVEVGADQQAFAGAPKPVTRGVKATPAAVKLQAGASVFRTGALDEFVR